jgi:peroxiredoxin/outer membrane lipoprotein-sorting protein
MGKGDGKIIIVGNGKIIYTYLRRGNVYQKAPAPKSLAAFQGGVKNGINTTGLLAGVDLSPLIKSAKLKPSEKIGGVDTYVIHVSLPSERKGSTANETIWVGKSDFMLRRIDMTVTMPPGAMPARPNVNRPTGPTSFTQKMVMSSIVADKPISDKTFRFVPPPGAKDASKIQMPKPPTPPNVMGKAAPGFTIPSIDGKQVSLSDYKGKPVLLVFWLLQSPQSEQMAPIYQKLQDAVKGSGAVMIGAYLGGDKDKLNKFLKDKGITFLTLFDMDKTFQLANEYGVLNVPMLYVIGADGKVKGKIMGPKTLDQLTSEVAKYGIK